MRSQGLCPWDLPSAPSVCTISAELSDPLRRLSERSQGRRLSGSKFLLAGALLWTQRLFGFFLLSSSWGDVLAASAMSLISQSVLATAR